MNGVPDLEDDDVCFFGWFEHFFPPFFMHTRTRARVCPLSRLFPPSRTHTHNSITHFHSHSFLSPPPNTHIHSIQFNHR